MKKYLLLALLGVAGCSKKDADNTQPATSNPTTIAFTDVTIKAVPPNSVSTTPLKYVIGFKYKGNDGNTSVNTWNSTPLTGPALPFSYAPGGNAKFKVSGDMTNKVDVTVYVPASTWSGSCTCEAIPIGTVTIKASDLQANTAKDFTASGLTLNVTPSFQ